MPQNGHQEVVMFYDAAEEIEQEFLFSDFEQKMLTGEVVLESRAASVTKGAYCVVGSGMQLAGIVYFLVNIDEYGCLDSAFNLPLRYLARQAGPSGTLEHGVVRVASRGRCAVPWHSLNLWEPKYLELDAMLSNVQQRLYRNRLGLKPTAPDCIDVFAEDDGPGMFGETDVLDLSELPVAPPTEAPDAPAAGPRPPQAAPQASGQSEAPDTQELQRRLTEVFGQAGKLNMQDLIRLHSEQLSQAKNLYQQEVQRHQAAHLEQLKGFREEIHQLKVSLRQEQSRNRRLQQMLRGDP